MAGRFSVSNATTTVLFEIIGGPFDDEKVKYEQRVKPFVEALLAAYVGCGFTDASSAAVDLLTDIAVYFKLDGFNGEWETEYPEGCNGLFDRALRAADSEIAEH